MLEVTGVTPQSRSGSQCLLQSNEIYFFGGYTKKDGEYFNDLYEFHIGDKHWNEIIVTNGEIPPKRTDHTLSLFKESLYVFGGYDGKNRFNDLCQFNLIKRE